MNKDYWYDHIAEVNLMLVHALDRVTKENQELREALNGRFRDSEGAKQAGVRA